MRRLVVAATCVSVALLAVAWVLPRASDAVGQWLEEEPVRARSVDVETVDESVVPPAVELPEEGSADADAPDLWRDTGVTDAGLRFNLLGAVGRRAADDGPAAEPAAESGETGGTTGFGEQGPVAVVEVRTSLDGEAWSDWMAMELDLAPDEAGSDTLVGEPLWVGEARYVEFRSSPGVADLELAFINSLGDATVADRLEGALKSAVATIASIGRAAPAAAAPDRPAIVRRSQWGADESWRRADPSYASRVKMAFIHHTAGGNTYTKAESPAVVRAIYYYHARTLGFNDIGYNFLVDRYGVIYEGRYGGMGKAVIGAQTLGFNTGSTGISVMGEFGSSAPPTAALEALERLLAWKLTYHGIDPTSAVSMYCYTSDKYRAGQWVTFPAIAGHRDACYTSCPGDAFYAKLRTIRRATDAIVAGAGEFRTRALRKFGVRRGRTALFRYRVDYTPAATATQVYRKARVVLKIRDARGRSRGTYRLGRKGLNRAFYHRQRLNLRRGTYRYYVLARLPDGTRQQVYKSARFRIR